MLFLLIVIVVFIIVFGGYHYGPGPWRQSGAVTPGYAPGLLGLLVTILIIVLVLRLLGIGI
jgi:hypothetical protein